MAKPFARAAALALIAVAPAAAQEWEPYQPSRVGDGRTVREFGTVGGDRHSGRGTSVGDNRDGANVYESMASRIEQLRSKVEAREQGPPPAPEASAPRGPIRVYSSVGPTRGFREPRTWPEQVRTFAEHLLTLNPRTAEEYLESEVDAAVMAALHLVHRGRLQASDEDLAGVLRRTRDPRVAKAAVTLLGRRGTPAAEQALVEHIRHHGRADAQAVKFLAYSEDPEVQRALLDKASQATADDEASLAAVLAIATHPSKEATTLLRRLGNDWSEEVYEAARDAWDARVAAGFRTGEGYRPPPVGLPVSKIALVQDEMRKLAGTDEWSGGPDEPFVPPPGVPGAVTDVAAKAPGDGMMDDAERRAWIERMNAISRRERGGSR